MAPRRSNPHYFRPRAEHARERDALRYLHSWSNVQQPASINRNAFPGAADEAAPSPETEPEPEPCSDAALAAFAQLCALRVNVRRVLVTIMSGSVEYVLAEATRSMFLQHDDPSDVNDALWLGTCSFPRSCGINALAMEAWRKARRSREAPPDPDHYFVQGRTAHYCVVSDTRNHAEYNQTVLAQHAPWLRFYCSVPLRDVSGSAIGSLSILDDRPRYGVSADEMRFLEDSADNIVEHLEASVVRAQRQRSERLIQALGLFNNKGSSLREWWLAQDDHRMERGGRYEKNEWDWTNQTTRLNDEFGIQGLEITNTPVASRRKSRQMAAEADTESVTAEDLDRDRDVTSGNHSAQNDCSRQGIAAVDFDSPLKGEESVPHAIGQDQTFRSTTVDMARSQQVDAVPVLTQSPPAQSPTVPHNALQHTYARATNLLREALNAEAVVCVDARFAASRLNNMSNGPNSAERASSVSSGSSDRPIDVTGSDTDGSESSSSSMSSIKACKVVGFSTRTRSTLTGTRSLQQSFGITPNELQRLIKRYPRGKIFNYEETGSLYSSSGDESVTGSNEDSLLYSRHNRAPKSKHNREAQRLGKIMVGARTIAFFPIWDNTSESWRSCIFVWSTTPMRFFDPTEDITYLAAFAHSLVAELSRLETLASDMAKGSFISSMSHELRSPLHGVLAGIEMIQESQLTLSQREMALNVNLAGRTLLDTVNHILDFSKISNLSKAQRRQQDSSNASRHQSLMKGSIDSSEGKLFIDLARLTEEVVETVVSGHRYHETSKHHTAGSPGTIREPSMRDDTEERHSLGLVSVMLDIEHRRNWNISIVPGAWTRILSNVVSNSLKYTKAGTIAIQLSVGDVPQNTKRGTVMLRISDSGIGMSQKFLDSDLYTPFKQVDAHSSGTGLGLSIVKQIASDLRADLDIQSDLGKGTSVKLTFQAEFAAKKDVLVSRLTDELSTAPTNVAKAQRLFFFSPEVQSQKSDFDNPGALVKSVQRIATHWLGCEVIDSVGPEVDSGTDVCVVSQSDLNYLSASKSQSLDALISSVNQRSLKLLVLAQSIGVDSEIPFQGFIVKPTMVTQPIGPQKLLRAIKDAPEQIVTQDSTSHEVNPAGRKPPVPLQASRDSRKRGTLQRQATLEKRDDLESLEPQTVSELSSIAASEDPVSQDIPSETTESNREVLLVEDNNINMRLLIALMTKLSLPYKCATNGLEALDLYSANPGGFFLILMDIDMPVMNGVTSTQKIREFEHKEKLKKTFIAALTGVTSKENRNICLASGMDWYMTKPIRMKELGQLVRDVLELE